MADQSMILNTHRISLASDRRFAAICSPMFIRRKQQEWDKYALFGGLHHTCTRRSVRLANVQHEKSTFHRTVSALLAFLLNRT